VGLNQQTIDALVAGQTPNTLSTEERVAQEFTHHLVAEHQVNQELHHRAVATFGEKGVVDMIFLAGNYVTTCALLNTFAVPAPVGTKIEDL
jgi:4-carboxymuconolactone decarboxylase